MSYRQDSGWFNRREYKCGISEPRIFDVQWKITSGLKGGRAGAVTLMESWTLEGYTVEVLVAIVVVRRILVDDKGSGPVLSDG